MNRDSQLSAGCPDVSGLLSKRQPNQPGSVDGGGSDDTPQRERSTGAFGASQSSLGSGGGERTPDLDKRPLHERLSVLHSNRGAEGTTPGLLDGRLTRQSGGPEVTGACVSPAPPPMWEQVRLPEGVTAPAGQTHEATLQDRRALADLSETMAGHLNQMYAFMQQAINRERVRHSSNVSLVMRKVDKDLKDTFRTVRETFQALTEQVASLAKEVESGREQVKNIQSRYQAAREAAEIRNQYVDELESTLDCNGPGMAETLKMLTEKSTKAAQQMEKASEEAKVRELALQDEIKDLRRRLQVYEDSEKEMSKGRGPPQLPEMSASWTRRSPTSDLCERSTTAASVEGPEVDIVGTMLKHSDAGRAVSRAKRTPSKAVSRRAGSTTLPARRSATPGDHPAELQQRAVKAEERCARQHKLVSLSQVSLILLRDVFSELHTQWRLHASDADEKVIGMQVGATLEPRKAQIVLDRIVQMFYDAIPRMGNFSEVIKAVAAEAATNPPRGRGTAADNAPGGAPLLPADRGATCEPLPALAAWGC